MGSQSMDIADKEAYAKESPSRKPLVMVVGTIIVLALIGGIVAAIVLTIDDGNDDDSTEVVEPPVPIIGEQRIDCFPESKGGVEIADEESCRARGCSWLPAEDGTDAPSCYVPTSEGQFGFRVTEGPVDTEFGFRYVLEPINKFAIYGDNFDVVHFDVENRRDNVLRFKFDVPSSNRWKVDNMIPLNLGNVRAQSRNYDVDVYQMEPFAFRVTRRRTERVLFDTGVGGLVFTDQFLQIATTLPSTNIYGLGENLHYNLKHDLDHNTWPIFARGQPPFSGDTSKRYNLYSAHPYYQCVEDDGQSHGVLLYNSNAMDYTVTPLPMLVYKTTGGILDFYIFTGPSPDSVVQQYTEAVGRPYMPPYWMLGYQLSRFGYTDVDEMKAAVDRTVASDIPMDVVYADIDYMDQFRIFTVDPVNYGGLKAYFEEIREKGTKTVIILDPAVEINEGYSIYTDGRSADIYVKWPSVESMPPGDYEEYGRTDMMGSAWPQWKVVFPDFFHSDMEQLWTDWIIDFRDNEVPFDALWLNMNEPANFNTNEDRPFNWPIEDIPTNWTLKCPESQWDDPPYRTMAAFSYDNVEEQRKERLSDKTLCMVGVHGDNGEYRHYDVHSLFGYTQTKSTLNSLRTAMSNITEDGRDLRSMIVTRSTFVGSGSHAGRWLGDNAATWDDLRLSIIGMLEFNIMGFPYVGADICGFFNDSPEELCMRWHELGAFYPYSRNHNHKDAAPQDPGYYGPAVADPTRDVMRIRYNLLPYLYTLFHKAHVEGRSVVRPLFFEFPDDPNTFDIDTQFMWGSGLLIVPILEEISVSNSLSFYAPVGRWYDYYTGALSYDQTTGEQKTVNGIDVNTPIQLKIRGGTIIPTQMYANNTHYSRMNNFGLKVALDADDGQALGELFWDDGESVDTYEKGEFHSAYFVADDKEVAMLVQFTNITDMDTKILDHVEIMGVTSRNADDSLVVYVNFMPHTQFTYDPVTKLLDITDLTLPMDTSFVIEYRDTVYATQVDADKQECCPEGGCDQTTCEAPPKNCIWEESVTEGVPSCYLDSPNFGYRYVDGSGFGQEGNLTFTWKGASTILGGDFVNVFSQVKAWKDVYHIRATDQDSPFSRYEVPYGLNLEPNDGGTQFILEGSLDPFVMKVKRADRPHYLFDTEIGGFTLADQFIQFTTRVPTTFVYGFGEHMHTALKHDFSQHRTWSIFARDEAPKREANLYGSHPFFVCVEPDGRAYGLLFWNSNAMEVTVTPAPAVSVRSIGGIMDVYIVIGDTLEEVIQRYTKMVGLPVMPPYWALGYQLSREGYNTLDNLNDVIMRHSENNLPLDVVHMDIDHLDESKSFTYDPVNFAGLPDAIDELHLNNMKVMPIVDAFLAAEATNYLPYEEGLSRDIFIKWPQGTSPDFAFANNDNMYGKGWPNGKVVFPDFLHPDSTAYWETVIADYYNTIEFDGLNLDMNEPASFDTNDGSTDALQCPNDNPWDNPIYKPTSLLGDRVSDKTICMVAEQGATKMKHYDVHSLYGHSQTMPTLSAIRNAIPGKRGLVISRSTFPGSGSYAGHTLGDNAAAWSDMQRSIISMIEFNWFGIPYVGADICGYSGDSSEELCQRWHQVGAFYPLARNHNGMGFRDQDPSAYSDNMILSTRQVLRTRYRLLPYLYTLFYHAATNGGTVARSLLNMYTSDPFTWQIEEQFMWGSALLVSPVLRQYARDVLAYFPADRWFDYYTGEEVLETRRWHYIHAPLDTIPLHVRGGEIITQQQPGSNVFESRQRTFELLVSPDDMGMATGDLFWDDGDSVNTVANNQYCLLNYAYSGNEVTSTVGGPDCSSMQGLLLDRLTVNGVENSVQQVTTSPASSTLTFTFDPEVKVLYVRDMQLAIDSNVTISWS